MVISTKGRYALRLMLDIALQETDSPVSLHVVADRQGISLKYLEQVVSPLCKAGLLRSVRGALGGYVIDADPTEITAGDILRAGEGNMAPVACLAADSDECPRTGQCITLPFWTGLDKAISNYIDSVTLEDLVAEVRGVNL